LSEASVVYGAHPWTTTSGLAGMPTSVATGATRSRRCRVPPPPIRSIA